MHGHSACLRVRRWFNKIHAAVQSAVGQRLGGDVHRLTLANLRQLLLVNISLDPYLAQIGNGEERIARVHILALRHLAIDYCSGGIGVNRYVRHGAGSRRVNLFV